jgi:hypothetical protein
VKVGLLSSYRTICGIAEYTGHLARGLKRAGADVLVLGSRNEGHRALQPDPATLTIPWLPVFDVQAWRIDGAHGLDVDTILDQGLDVLHVQYEVILFHRERLQQLLDRFEGVKAITWHDSCVPPDMPGPWDLQLRHRADTGPGGAVIPMGVESVQPLVRTFGLGRSREDIICTICDRNGWRFEASFGDRRWLNEGDLHAWLREADAVVLWYPEVDSAGSSLAARTALAARRPLIVNDVTWFRDLPESAPGLQRVPDQPLFLEAALHNVLDSPYIDACSWDQVARYHLDAYANADAHRERPLAQA